VAERAALITGGSSGIGMAIARALAADGYGVTISARRPDKLQEAGAEHGKALIANMASIAGKRGQGWLSVYSATKAGVVGFSQATQRECDGQGIQVTALCPGFVDTPMTEFIRDHVAREDMIRPEDIAESVRFLLRTSPACLVPEIVFTRPGEGL
jgi:short-subunit dehydrogenase